MYELFVHDFSEIIGYYAFSWAMLIFVTLFIVLAMQSIMTGFVASLLVPVFIFGQYVLLVMRDSILFFLGAFLVACIIYYVSKKIPIILEKNKEAIIKKKQVILIIIFLILIVFILILKQTCSFGYNYVCLGKEAGQRHNPQLCEDYNGLYADHSKEVCYYYYTITANDRFSCYKAVQSNPYKKLTTDNYLDTICTRMTSRDPLVDQQILDKVYTSNKNLEGNDNCYKEIDGKMEIICSVLLEGTDEAAHYLSRYPQGGYDKNLVGCYEDTGGSIEKVSLCLKKVKDENPNLAYRIYAWFVDMGYNLN